MTDLLTIRRGRQPAEVLLASLKPEDKNGASSLRAGENLVRAAKDARLSIDDYLRLAVDVTKGTFAEVAKANKLDGYEVALAYLDLPVRENISEGVLLQAAAETFTTYPGTRALFPPVIDNILQWKYRQDQIENVAALVSQSRTINGNEMITTVVDDKANDYQQTGVIAEGAEIPVRSLRTSEFGVKFYKFGGGIEFTYEFERRASLDLITPYAARMQREVEIGQTAIATAMLINGDGTAAHGAAPVVNASDLAETFPTAGQPVTSAGRINWEVFLKWMVSMAQKGTPMDTIVGNWDMYLEWLRMFATPTANAGVPQIELLQKAGVQVAIDNPRLPLNMKFALSSTAPAGKLIGFIKAETLEELIENGSDIEESTRAITNQRVRYVKTTNRGYRMVFGDTRSVLNLDAS
jgi:hypothetical protein